MELLISRHVSTMGSGNNKNKSEKQQVLGDSCHAQIDIYFMVNLWSTSFADHGSLSLFSIYSAQD